MNYISLQLDAEAQAIAGALLDGLDDNNGWLKMTARFAQQIDSKLSESLYVGKVKWFSDSDYIEKEIEYQ
ncbi:hypothetical protein L4D76_24940 [Photobacterium sagamiensis]|uniref:hypothetical protein n=1 Tax=Photobacterium sagamiensis TaxID=2910241 RepID=UPI003D0A15FE